MLSEFLECHVQTRTSLESLGTGGVQFSRKFTFQELKDRWLFLISHANVVVEASPDIAVFLDPASALSPKPHILANKIALFDIKIIFQC